MANFEKVGGGGECVYRIRHHILPFRHSLPRFAVEQFGATAFPIFVGEKRDALFIARIR